MEKKTGIGRDQISNPLVLGDIVFASPTTQPTVGAAGGASALPATPTLYLLLVVGNTEYVMPLYART